VTAELAVALEVRRSVLSAVTIVVSTNTDAGSTIRLPRAR
jgi:hypothetical protein